ncbi:uncharacterized protein TNCV_999341 [Trichonephila clavipes]|nr:uncharacterized protein TNCV_999341 [Trichonephila clavipes]
MIYNYGYLLNCEEGEQNNFIWQQDGTPPHWHLSACDWLNITVPNQWIGCKEPPDKASMEWPPRSPGLKSCDFYLRRFIKNCVKVPLLPADLTDLRHLMEADVARISPGTPKKVWDELAYQLNLCHLTNGAHIEHL